VGFLLILLTGLLIYQLFPTIFKINPARVVGSSILGARAPILQLDSNDSPHIAWYGGMYTTDYQIYYVSWDGTSWVSADDKKGIADKSISKSIQHIYLHSLILDSNSHPLLTWGESDESSEKGGIVFVKWDGERWITHDNTPYDPTIFDGIIAKGWRSSIAIDSDDNPHITWENDSFVYPPKILYIKFDGENWITAGGKKPTNDDDTDVNKNNNKSYFANIALDSNDNPCLLWLSKDINDNDRLVFIRHNGDKWVTINSEDYNPETENAYITEKVFSIHDFTLEIDSEDKPHICWHYTCIGGDPANLSPVSYIKWNGDNWVEIDDTDYSPETANSILELYAYDYPNLSFKLDSNSNPHFNWSEWLVEDNRNIDRDVYYAKWNCSNLVTIDNEILDQTKHNGNISNNNFESRNPSIVLDSKNNPHITWWDCDFQENNYDEIMYVKWNGENWVCADGSVYKPSE